MKHTALHLLLVAFNVAGVAASAWEHDVFRMCIFAVGAFVVAEIGAQTREIIGANDEIQKRIDVLRQRQ